MIHQPPERPSSPDACGALSLPHSSPGLSSVRLLDCCSFAPPTPLHSPTPFCFYTCMLFSSPNDLLQRWSNDSHLFLWPAHIVLCEPISRERPVCVCSGCTTPVMSLMLLLSYWRYGVYMHTHRNQDYPMINIGIHVTASYFWDRPTRGDRK